MKEFKMKINGSEYTVNIESIEDTHAKVEVNGTMYDVEIDKPIRQTIPVIHKVKQQNRLRQQQLQQQRR